MISYNIFLIKPGFVKRDVCVRQDNKATISTLDAQNPVGLQTPSQDAVEVHHIACNLDYFLHKI